MKPVVLITGVSSAVGAACARRFADAGYGVCGADAALSDEANRAAAASGGVLFERDVRDWASARKTVDSIVQRFGRLEALLTCAGAMKDVDNAWEVSLKGIFNYLSAAAPHFKNARSGKVVAIAPNDGSAGPPHGLAVRTAIIGLARACARDLGKYNVNVNAVAPELVRMNPEDVAGVVHFLCTEEARHITGEVLYVNGGAPA